MMMRTSLLPGWLRDPAQRGLRRLCGLVAGAALVAAEPQGLPTETVGMPGRFTIELPGSELEAVPGGDPLQVRIAERHAHTNGFHYELEFLGFEPGRYDLRPRLRRKDRSPADGLPAIWVEVLPAGSAGQVQPHPLERQALPRPHSYTLTLIGIGVLWLVGLLLLLLHGRRRLEAATDRGPPPITLADRMRPLVQDAIAGKLRPEQRAELERLLVAHWRERLQLQQLNAAEAVAKLRADPEAGAMLAQLDQWLHRPKPSVPVDVGKLLEPYAGVVAARDAVP